MIGNSSTAKRPPSNQRKSTWTSISTIAGLIPLIMESNPHIQLLIPMATSLAFGLMMSTILGLHPQESKQLQ